MHDCPSRYGRGGVQPTGSAAGSSSVRPVGQTPQIPAGRGRGRGGASTTGATQPRMYALAERQDLESSPDVVKGTLSVFFHDVYALIHPGSTLSYISPYVIDRIRVKPKPIKPFEVSTPVGDPVIARQV